MPPRRKRVALPGSEHEPLAAARRVGRVPADERVDVTVLLRPRSDRSPSAEPLGAQLPGERQYLTRKELADARGADPADIAQVEEFARAHDLDVVGSSAARRSVVVSGTVAALSKAFGTKLARYEAPGGTYRGRTGPLYVPPELAPLVVAVLGLDDRPQATPHFRPLTVGERSVAQPHAGRISYTPLQLADLYDFPAGADGTGERIAIVELGGGYKTADLTTYFKKLGVKKPKVTAVSVDGAKNAPTGDATGPDGEVLLDIEVAGAMAPGAEILVYFAPNTDRGFLDAITRAVHDRREPSVISISWGAAEANWTDQAMAAMDQAFQDAATVGVTVLCAAGDDGSNDNVGDGKAHVDFPASSPHVVACGGTNLVGSNGSITSEVVWNGGKNGGATGGGISDVFPLPAWQTGARVPTSANPDKRKGRGVPDVAADADPATGYEVRVDGEDLVFGGTSAVAPLWAALVARLNQHLGKPVGLLNPILYGLRTSSGEGAFRDITKGTNGAYRARNGWDACTGLGSPDGTVLLDALSV
jgi:kumamolisin